MLGGTDERRVTLKRADEDRRVLKWVERLAGIALVHRILPSLRAPIGTLVNHTARKYDDFGVQDVGKRAQASTKRKAGVMDDLGRLFVASTAQVVHVAADRRTAGVDSTETLIVHAANRGTRSHRLKMAGATASTGNAGGGRALDMAHMTGGTVESLHHATVLDIRATDARANTQAQHGELTLADAPMGLTQGMGLHIAHHGNGKPQILAQARPQLNAGPARHNLVGIRDGARLGIDDACGTDTDTDNTVADDTDKSGGKDEISTVIESKGAKISTAEKVLYVVLSVIIVLLIAATAFLTVKWSLLLKDEKTKKNNGNDITDAVKTE